MNVNIGRIARHRVQKLCKGTKDSIKDSVTNWYPLITMQVLDNGNYLGFLITTHPSDELGPFYHIIIPRGQNQECANKLLKHIPKETAFHSLVQAFKPSDLVHDDRFLSLFSRVQFDNLKVISKLGTWGPFKEFDVYLHPESFAILRETAIQPRFIDGNIDRNEIRIPSTEQYVAHLQRLGFSFTLLGSLMSPKWSPSSSSSLSTRSPSSSSSTPASSQTRSRAISNSRPSISSRLSLVHRPIPSTQQGPTTTPPAPGPKPVDVEPSTWNPTFAEVVKTGSTMPKPTTHHEPRRWPNSRLFRRRRPQDH